MPNLNRVFLMGNLTRDPELRYTPGGTAVTDVGLAVNRRVQDKATGTWKEETTFIDVTFWGRKAEVVCEYMQKGRPMFVEGRLQLDSWEDRQTGQKRSRLKVVGEQIEFIGGRQEGGRQEGGRPLQASSAPSQQDNSPDYGDQDFSGGDREPPRAQSSPSPSVEAERSPAESFYDPPASEGPEDVPF